MTLKSRDRNCRIEGWTKSEQLREQGPELRCGTGRADHDMRQNEKPLRAKYAHVIETLLAPLVRGPTTIVRDPNHESRLTFWLVPNWRPTSQGNQPQQICLLLRCVRSVVINDGLRDRRHISVTSTMPCPPTHVYFPLYTELTHQVIFAYWAMSALTRLKRYGTRHLIFDHSKRRGRFNYALLQIPEHLPKSSRRE